MKDRPRVLVVDDDPDVSAMLNLSLTRRGFQIDSLTSPEEALQRAETVSYDAAVLDLVMPGRDGAQLAKALRTRMPGLPVAVLTGYTHSPLLADFKHPGLAIFIKPVIIQDLVEFLQAEIS